VASHLKSRKVSEAAAAAQQASDVLDRKTATEEELHSTWGAWRAVGEDFSRLRMTEEAVSAFRSSLRTLPRNAHGHIRLAWELVTRAKQYAEAALLFKEAMEANSNAAHIAAHAYGPSAYMLIADALASQGNHMLAVQLYGLAGQAGEQQWPLSSEVAAVCGSPVLQPVPSGGNDNQLFTHIVTEHAVSKTLLAGLQHSFRSKAKYWKENFYFKRKGYFSHYYPVAEHPQSVVEQAIQALLRHIPKSLRVRITGAEWWAHIRRFYTCMCLHHTVMRS